MIGFPQPPAFGPGIAAIFAAFVVLAIVGTTFRAGPLRQASILRRVALMFAVTFAAFTVMILSAGHHGQIPTMDLLPKPFGLEGEGKRRQIDTIDVKFRSGGPQWRSLVFMNGSSA